MAREYAVIFKENLPVPLSAFTYEGFQGWFFSDDFPDTGRIDFVAGDVEVEMSPEDLYTHGVVKAAFAKTLQALISDGERGEVYIDRTRILCPAAGLSVEPDVVAVLWDSFASGRVRAVPSARKGEEGFVALEGAPDVIVEVVSDRSKKKDTETLPRLYARAGVPELWLTDARGKDVRFSIRSLQDGDYVTREADTEGWVPSPQLGGAFRLLRLSTPRGHWRYVLEHRL